MVQRMASALFVAHAATLLAGAVGQVTPPPSPGPPPGPPCDLAACTCAGVDLKNLEAKGVVQSGPDGEGYSYKLSFCTEIPAAQLPTGCQQYAEHPAIVKFKTDNLADCIEIGSIGPCSQGSCGMTGVKTASGVDVTYTYTYGCENTFTLSLTSGIASKPGAVTSNECSYSASWAALSSGGLAGVAGSISPISIVTFVLIFGGFPLYIAVGVTIRVKTQGEELGVQAIPQILFWKSLPGLILDGMKFSGTELKEIFKVLHAKATKKEYQREPSYRGKSDPATASVGQLPKKAAAAKEQPAVAASATKKPARKKSVPKVTKGGDEPLLASPKVKKKKSSSKSGKSSKSKKSTPAEYGGAKE